MISIHQILNNIFLATVFPGVLIALWLIGLLSIGTLKICLIISFIIFIILPIIFKYSASLQRGILFLTFIAYPKNASSFNNINEFGLYGSRNFYVTHRDDDENISLVNSSENKNDDGQIYIGVWHILPNFIVKKFAKQLNLSQDELHQFTNTIVSEADQQSLVKIENHLHDTYGEINNINQKEFFEDVLRKVTAPIVIYLHGNTGSRGQPHRVDLYKILRNIGCHVIAIDYRGYGDSSKVQPTELGVIRDSIAVYNYVRSITKTNDIFIWGHSLGTGVSTHMLSILNQNKTIIGLNVAPKVVVLESPFNNIRDEVREHPFAKLFKNLPWFDFTIAQPMYSNCLRFESDQHIGEFRQPVLILHAEDDIVVPFRLGHMLYRSALDKRGRSWGPIEFHRFDKSHGYGHKYICRSPQLPDIIRNFFITYRNEIY